MTERIDFPLVLGITGGIAAYKAADLIRRLRELRDPARAERRVAVRVILTRMARNLSPRSPCKR